MPWWQRFAGLGALGVVAFVAQPVTSASVTGAAGTDTRLPPTESQVTVSGRGPFKDVKFTVNQTQQLLNQAVSVSWTGAAPTISRTKPLSANFMQLMQCWGDDDGTHPDNPGPPPEQCVGGALEAISDGVPNLPIANGEFLTQRIISRKDWPNYDPNVGVLDPRTDFVWRPFRAVDGKKIDVQWDPTFNPSVSGGVYWENPYFNLVTTNEAFARTGADGKGATPFEVTTGIESTGLGCGQKVQPVAGGDKRVPKCWLVIVPRGRGEDENAGAAGITNADVVSTSPLAPAQWKNRVAIPLAFTPVDSPCSLSAEQRRLGGSEFAAPAVYSWQPKLCQAGNSQPYVYGTLGDAIAREQLVKAPPGAPGLVVVSRPVDQAQLDPDSPIVYAPLTLSGLAVTFNVERVPDPSAPADEKLLQTVPVAHLNLTPRLLAKLLTQSYRGQLEIQAVPPGYAWDDKNPANLGLDPDFLQFNPEFAQLSVPYSKNFGGFVMPSSTSDAARQLWSYVLADPEAKAWLDGQADPWGMKVNPVYATSASANANHVAFGDPLPTSFPKSEPYCYQSKPVAGAGGTAVVPPALCGTDWLPYAENLREAARRTQKATDGAKTTFAVLPQSADQAWKRDDPQTGGSRSFLALSDSASAFQYGVQTASLSRPGDNGASRKFIQADSKGFEAGVGAMKPGTQQAVLEPDPKAASPDAYPLTVLTYGAAKPLSLDTTARQQYAAFVDYAASQGQAPGQDIGELPPGFAPLPASLQTQARNAAKAIRELKPVPAEEAAAPAAADEPVQAAPALPSESSPASVGSESGSPSPLSSDSTPTAAPITQSAPLGPGVLPATASPRGVTPVLSIAATRFALPVLGGIALLAALIALEITKRPRLVRADSGDGASTQEGGER